MRQHGHHVRVIGVEPGQRLSGSADATRCTPILGADDARAEGYDVLASAEAVAA